MDELRKKVIEKFGNALRVRVSGICVEGTKILLVNHRSLRKDADFWSPPGGGMEFGQSAEENLKREFLEETGLIISIKKFLCVHEFLQPPLHAIELFFLVEKIGGTLKTGIDPEMGEDQIIQNVCFMDFKGLLGLHPDHKHQILFQIRKSDDIDQLSTFYPKISSL